MSPRASVVTGPRSPVPALAALRAPSAGSTAVQPTLDEVGTPLHEVTFVVVDLETTGGSPATCAITEIGAVKVRGGEVLGEFQTLVNPGGPVPAQITVLTGITTAMVIDAPRITEVLPSFLEFARGAVLVAHNARFDVGFLKAAASAMDLAWPSFTVVDTVPLARRVVPRDEAPNHKLGTLAGLFHATVTPDHRALSDARATVDVLHALLGRLAPWGITHLEDLATAADPVAPAVRAKRTLADGLPSGPGVYLFHGPDDEVLYVGTSQNVRGRVRSYFTAAEKRRAIAEMLQIAHRVSAISCATTLEARIRELRLIAGRRPRYNRRSKFPERMPWVRLTAEAHPRLSVVSAVAPGPAVAAPGAGLADAPVHIGPFASRRAALQAVEAVQGSFLIRRCTRRLPRVAPEDAVACPLAELGRCVAPCMPSAGPHGEPGSPRSPGAPHAGPAPVSGRHAHDDVVTDVRTAMSVTPAALVDSLTARIAALADDERFEEAATERDRLAAFLDGAARAERFASLAQCAELVAALPDGHGAWELVVVRYGRMAATGVAPAGTDPYTTIDALLATAEDVLPPIPPATAAHPEETSLLLAWLDAPGVRLVRTTAPAAHPVRGAQSFGAVTATIRAARGARRD